MTIPKKVPDLRAPKEGAIYLSEQIPGFASAGQWIWFDPSGAGVMNLTTGQALPMAMHRQPGSPFAFSGAPPSPVDVHTPVVISNWLGGWQNFDFLLDVLVQQQPVDYTQFEWRDMSQNNKYLLHDVRASSNSSVPQVQLTSSVSQGKTEDLRVGAFVPYRTESEADFPFFLQSAAVAADAIALWREYQAFGPSGLFMTAGNWANAVKIALGGTENWGPNGGGAASNPIANLKAARRASGKRDIKFFVMNLQQFDWFIEHPLVIDHYKAFNEGGLTAGMVRQIVREQQGTADATTPSEVLVPGVGRILIHNGYATTDPAVEATPFWSNDIVLGFAQAKTMPPNDDMATAVTFVHKNPSNGTVGLPAGVGAGMASNNGYRTRLVDMPLQGHGGRLIIIDRSEKTLFTANNIGAYISGVS